MEIQKSFINHSLSFLTVGYFDRHDTPPEDFSDYGPQIESLRKYLAQQNMVEKFCITLDYLSVHPEIPLRDIVTLTFPFSNAELRDMVTRLRQYLYPFENPTAPDILKNSRIVD